MEPGQSERFETLGELAQAILKLTPEQQSQSLRYREPYDGGDIRTLNSLFIIDEDEKDQDEDTLKVGTVILL